MKSTMRVTRIDLDDTETPTSVHVVMSWDVMDRLCREHHAIRNHRRLIRPDGDLWANVHPVEWAARMALIYGDLPIRRDEDPVALEVWRCMSLFCNRWWSGGAREALRDLVG